MNMTDIVKEPHTGMFIGATGCGKSRKVLELLGGDYRGHFEYIVVLCPTIADNKTYQNCLFLWVDDCVFLIDPKDKLLSYIEKLSADLSGSDVLFVIDDCIANEELDKKRSKLTDLVISGRHRNHSVWLLTQSYTAIPKNLRRQLKQIFIWYLKERSDFKLVDEETNVIDSGDEWKKIRDELKSSRYGHLFLRLEHPRGYKLIV